VNSLSFVPKIKNKNVSFGPKIKNKNVGFGLRPRYHCWHTTLAYIWCLVKKVNQPKNRIHEWKAPLHLLRKVTHFIISVQKNYLGIDLLFPPSTRHINHYTCNKIIVFL
jgi:hypothetical protein